jgi:uncharacterized 2Fe-2S/4Fe-4S cluster protein (DUF4445 family)
MPNPPYTVTFRPQGLTVKVEPGTTLLEAAVRAGITFNNLCGGTGTCRRCRMVIREGDVPREATQGLSPEEIREGSVLACMTVVEDDLTVEIPADAPIGEPNGEEQAAKRFRDMQSTVHQDAHSYPLMPLMRTLHLKLPPPSLENQSADLERLTEAIAEKTGAAAVHMDLAIMKQLPRMLRENDWCLSAAVAQTGGTAEVVDLAGGHREGSDYVVVMDIGTTTLVAELIDSGDGKTVGRRACFNSQATYGSEVTARMIAAEKKGLAKLQASLTRDINDLIGKLAAGQGINPGDIRAIVCAGNTVMIHFLLGLPTGNIRRSPYIAAAVVPPPVGAASVGINIQPNGLLYPLPGVSGWVGGDITAGILATGIQEREEISLLMDIGTNGEIVIGNREWLVATSASAGPALEGASIECGMRAEPGAIERVFVRDNRLAYKTIGDAPARGICGSGIIDLLSVLLKQGVIDRSGQFSGRDIQPGSLTTRRGIRQFELAVNQTQPDVRPVYLTEGDIENIITAKAAIFAAMKILIGRLQLTFSDIRRFYIAGAFGHYIDIDSAAAIGLIPNLPAEKIEFVGNTALQGARLAALSRPAFARLGQISRNTTYYDLMGAADYVEEFRKAMFLPHTDIEEFESWRKLP